MQTNRSEDNASANSSGRRRSHNCGHFEVLSWTTGPAVDFELGWGWGWGLELEVGSGLGWDWGWGLELDQGWDLDLGCDWGWGLELEVD